MLAKEYGIFMLYRLLLTPNNLPGTCAGHGGPQWHGGAVPSNHAGRTGTGPWPVSPVPIPTATISIASTLVTLAWWNGPASTSVFGDCTAIAAAIGSVSARAHLWNTPSCRKKQWCASSSAWATDVPLRLRRTFVRWIHGRCSTCSKTQGGERKTSIACSWINSSSHWKRWRWMRYTAESARHRPKKGAPRADRAQACSVASRPGSSMGSRGVGRNEPLPGGSAGWSSYAGGGQAIGGLGVSGLLREFALAADRRSLALSGGDPGRFRPDMSSSPTERSRTQAASGAETAAGTVGRCGPQGPRRNGQPDWRKEMGVVWWPEANPPTHCEVGDWRGDQHLPYRTSQRHDAGSADATGTSHTQPFPWGELAPVGAVAVARPVQLDAAPRIAGWTKSCDDARLVGPRLVGRGVRVL